MKEVHSLEEIFYVSNYESCVKNVQDKWIYDGLLETSVRTNF